MRQYMSNMGKQMQGSDPNAAPISSSPFAGMMQEGGGGGGVVLNRQVEYF